MLQLAASLESGSEHPLAMAIVESAQERGLHPGKVTNFNAIAGHGVEADVDGKHLLFGNEKLMRDRKIECGSLRGESTTVGRRGKNSDVFRRE